MEQHGVSYHPAIDIQKMTDIQEIRREGTD